MNMKATQQLKDEHEGVKIMLNILGRVYRQLEETGNLDTEHFKSILEFLSVFVDKCHHGKEEECYLCWKLQAFQKMALFGVIYEHQVGREYAKAMDEAFAKYQPGNRPSSQGIIRNARDYISLLTNHIEKENNVLFVMADSCLSEKMQDELFEGFEKIEEERIGIGKHEEFHGMLEKLSGIYLS